MKKIIFVIVTLMLSGALSNILSNAYAMDIKREGSQSSSVHYDFNHMINISSEYSRLGNHVNEQFFKQLHDINLWINTIFSKYGAEKYGNEAHEKYMAVLSTIKTMAFLYAYGDNLYQLEEASPAYIKVHLQQLFSQLNEIKPPNSVNEDDRPEDTRYEASFLDFEKINRLLFNNFDLKLINIFKAHQSDGIDFAEPIVEWAANILPSFSYQTELVDQSYHLNLSKLKELVEHYNPEELKKYLIDVWPKLIERFDKLKSLDNPVEYKKNALAFIDPLTCTMCYPARVQLLVFATQTSMVSEKVGEPEKSGIAKVTTRDILDRYLSEPILSDLTVNFFDLRCLSFAQQNPLTNHLSLKDIKDSLKLQLDIQKHAGAAFCTNYLNDMTHYIITNYIFPLHQNGEINREIYTELIAENGKEIKQSLVHLYSWYGVPENKICGPAL